MRWKQADNKKKHDIPTKDGPAKGKWKEKSNKEKNINEEASSSKGDPRGEPSSSVPHALGGSQAETEGLSKRSRETVDRDLEWGGGREASIPSKTVLPVQTSVRPLCSRQYCSPGSGGLHCWCGQ